MIVLTVDVEFGDGESGRLDLREGDVGNTLHLVAKNGGAVIVLPPASTNELVFKPPQGKRTVVAGTLPSDGVDGVVSYDLQAGDIRPGVGQLFLHHTRITGIDVYSKPIVLNVTKVPGREPTG